MESPSGLHGPEGGLGSSESGWTTNVHCIYRARGWGRRSPLNLRVRREGKPSSSEEKTVRRKVMILWLRMRHRAQLIIIFIGARRKTARNSKDRNGLPATSNKTKKRKGRAEQPNSEWKLCSCPFSCLNFLPHFSLFTYIQGWTVKAHLSSPTLFFPSYSQTIPLMLWGGFVVLLLI